MERTPVLSSKLTDQTEMYQFHYDFIVFQSKKNSLLFSHCPSSQIHLLLWLSCHSCAP